MSEHEEQPHQDEHERPASGHRPGGGEGTRQIYEPRDDGAAADDDTPGPSGYEGREPKSDMPRVSSAPETQDQQDQR
jgi:hypothetical protein